MFDSISNKSRDPHPQLPAWNGITCINPRAPTKLVALGSREGFSVNKTPTSNDDPTFLRRLSFTIADEILLIRSRSELYLARAAAT